MSIEGQIVDKKSLRMISGPSADWAELAKDCVAFANAQGGQVLIGIEDGDNAPPADQTVSPALMERVRQRIDELTVNVMIAVQIQHSATTGGEYMEVDVSRSASPASTTDGRYYVRVGDNSKPLVGEQVQRLLNERSAQPWETLTTLHINQREADPSLRAELVAGIRNSDRVKDSVKDKSDDELLKHYQLSNGQELTNLGILCIGRSEHRAQLGTAPVVQFLKYDETGSKVHKISWDDHTRSPMQLIDAVWQDIPDFQETYEFPDGLFRQQIPVFDGRVIRELLVNALVHRPYTQRGDIYLNLYPDRLVIVNPGLLPLGVTPRNILHQSIRRNNELARLFHDLKMMEREGSGYDLLYDILLSQGRQLPEIREETDRVEVVIKKRIVKSEVIDFLAKADQTYALRQRERITLGLLAQHEVLSGRELADMLELTDTAEISPWLGRLLDLNVVKQTGRTKGTRYYVEPNLLRRLDFPPQTSLARIEPHRLDALVLEDISRYPGSSIGEIHERIGAEIKRRQVKSALDRLCASGRIRAEGQKRGRKYHVIGQSYRQKSLKKTGLW